MNRQPPDLTLSIISADNMDLLVACLRSVFENTKSIDLEVFVVDNASGDTIAPVITSQFPQVEVIRNEARQGFSTNNNLVLRRGTGRYLMLLNDDTVIESGALEKLVEFMDAHDEAGAVGSSLLNPDGSPQATFARFPSPVVEAVWPATNWSYRSLRDVSEPFEVDSVCGAAMLVRRPVIEQVGTLDTGFDPIYSEEIDWCFRIKQAGWRIYALPQSRIIHYGSVTMNRAVPYKYEMLLSHKLLFFRKHYGVLGAETYRVTMGMTTLAKLLWWTVGSLVDDGRSEKRDLHWHLLRRIPAL